ncbi:hypothetical protein HUA74_06290 [Myxococcus sp. CA051A]|uniref:Uncharacterized protein n=1 Tax=Myxococcus llanfairpwllgwyngyllgogerychwyrndrobwllllantysiliogogogochensis TaxID=2590453 RepID=A0A540XB17_9BACT|nr:MULTISPECIES: hypothetical protein [Myxococcus]NTX02565.1 hypothetical protein [Myxococcus sp. CA040A]NTX40916.1 hypothetical protein [Myxococcus sp. CA033]NTX56693.1 hypothetical protein [Myxococcus sp. CA039A]NTX60262.1 hypothetical protein [Myxococcus sp. CA051A]TQF17864.1 hypothetical protein FJV41_00505 [Myxococcus llanfairpwllgwyngyllgogerychwyrndrobwllllantysiliogogogochensis]
MKNWVTLCLVCIASGAFAADKTPPAKTPPPSTTKPAPESKAAEPRTLTIEEDKAAKQEPKNKKVDTKATETASKPLL